MFKIGIMGGTFNPIHNGHLLVANDVMNKLKLNQVMFIPNHQPSQIENKQVNVSGVQRLKMVNLAIKDNPQFISNNIELKRSGVSYMYDTIKELKQQYSNIKYQFYLILGADEINSLSHWYKINQLAKMVKFVSVDRNNHFGKTRYSVIKVHVPTFDVSSTLIRNRIENNQSVKYLTNNKVIKYINKHHLYKN